MTFVIIYQDSLYQINIAMRPTNYSDKPHTQPGLTHLHELLPRVLNNLGLEKRLKEHTLMGFWSSVVPGNLSEHTRPLFIDSQNNFVIAVSSASAAQELSLMKAKILRLLSKPAFSLGLELKGIRTDFKHFYQPACTATEEAPALPKPKEEELQALSLGDMENNLLAQLSQALEKNRSHQAGLLNEKICKLFERQLRLMLWRRNHGYPCCHKCSTPPSRLYSLNGLKLCLPCLQQTK